MPALSLSSLPCNDRHPPGRGFHAPPPLIIQTTSATTPFVLGAAKAHVDWWTHDPFSFSLFFFFYFLIPPYVSMAHMTSLPSHPLYHDTISHFLTFFSLSKSKGMGRGNGSAAPSSVLLHIYDETDKDFYSFFYLSFPADSYFRTGRYSR